MSDQGKIKVVVRSRRVPVRLVEISRPFVSYSGIMAGSESSRAILYESVLDEEHRNAVEEGQRLADQMGLKLEIVDESRLNLLRRALSFLGNGAGSPRLVITPSYSPPSDIARSDHVHVAR